MSAPKMQYVVFHTLGTAWQADVPYPEQPGVMAHVQHYQQLDAEGKLALGGPFMDERGGMMIAQPEVSYEEIEAFAAADPAVKSGLLNYEVVAWRVVMRGED